MIRLLLVLAATAVVVGVSVLDLAGRISPQRCHEVSAAAFGVLFALEVTGPEPSWWAAGWGALLLLEIGTLRFWYWKRTR